MDDIDRRILNILQKDGRICNADIAREVGMVPSATLERVRKLEKQGLIAGYEARLNPKLMGAGLLAFIFVRTDDRWGSLKNGERLCRIPEVLEVHNVAGEDCYLIKVRVADTAALARLLRDKLGDLDTRSTVVLETLKESSQLPLPENNDSAQESQ